MLESRHSEVVLPTIAEVGPQRRHRIDGMEDAADKPDQRQQQLASQIDAAPSSSIWNIDNDGPEVTPTELGAALDKPMDDEAAKHQLPHQAERVKAVMDDVDGVAGPLKPQTDDQPGDAAEVATEQDVAGAQKRAAPHPESSIVDEPHEDKLVLESFVLYKTESVSITLPPVSVTALMCRTYPEILRRRLKSSRFALSCSQD